MTWHETYADSALDRSAMLINGDIAEIVASGDASTAAYGGVREATGSTTSSSTAWDPALLERLLVHLLNQDVDIV